MVKRDTCKNLFQQVRACVLADPVRAETINSPSREFVGKSLVVRSRVLIERQSEPCEFQSQNSADIAGPAESAGRRITRLARPERARQFGTAVSISAHFKAEQIPWKFPRRNPSNCGAVMRECTNDSQDPRPVCELVVKRNETIDV